MYKDLKKTRSLKTRQVFCVFLTKGSARDPGFIGHADLDFSLIPVCRCARYICGLVAAALCGPEHTYKPTHMKQEVVTPSNNYNMYISYLSIYLSICLSVVCEESLEA